MPFVSSGTLTTDTREIAISETWDTQTDWEAYQSINGINITSGTLELAEVQVIDRFEGGDLSAYSGDTGSFTVDTNDPVYEGSNSLKGNGVGDLIHRPSGVDDEPSRATRWRWRAYMQDGSDNAQHAFNLLDANNFHMLSFNNDMSELRTYEVTSGSFNEISNVSMNFPENEWVTGRHEWQSDDTLTTTVLDASGSEVGTDSVSITPIDDGGSPAVGIGIRGVSNVETIIYDDLVLEANL